MKRKLSPGTIVYVDSNFSVAYDCFGVIVEENFWHAMAEAENILGPEMGHLDDRHQLFRVLGCRLFRKYWQANDPNALEPDEHAIMHYRFAHDNRVTPVNLRLFLLESLKDGGRVGRLLWNGNSDYIATVLRDIKVIQRYLGGERFKNDGHTGQEEKFLRLLGSAIPL